MIEYKILKAPIPEVSESQLDTLGGEGWELVTIFLYEDEYYYYFKRNKLQ